MKASVLLIDPPVQFKAWSEKSKSPGRRASAHYGTMSWASLAALGPSIDAVAADDCAMFLWVTSPLIPDTLKLATTGFWEKLPGNPYMNQYLPGWEWNFKTVAFVWSKTTRDRLRNVMGLGYWTRPYTEQCWLFTRGTPKRIDKGVPQLIETIEPMSLYSPRLGHSQKPEAVHHLIERLMGDVPRIELFARRRVPGWTCIGDELTGNDIREDLRLVTNDLPLPVRVPATMDIETAIHLETAEVAI